MQEHGDEDGDGDGRRLARSRRLAIAAFLLAMTSLLVPWWQVAWEADGTTVREQVSAFRPKAPLTTGWGPWVTGALVAAAALLLFVRCAGRSERYEPRVWRRDLAVGTVLLALAAASALLWPQDVPSFWGGRTYVVADVDTQVRETAMPLLGWWLALLAAATVGGAGASARRRPADGVGTTAK